MVYLALLVIAAAVVVGCILFVSRAKGGPLGVAWRWSIAAFAVATGSALMFLSAEALPGSGDVLNGSLELLGLLLWLVSIPMGFVSLVMVVRACIAGVRAQVLAPLLLTLLSFSATWYRTLLA